MKSVTQPEWPLGPPLKARRDAAGLSQTAAARLAGISTSKWRQLESGFTKTRSGIQEAGTTPTTVARAARAVGWDISEALTVAGYDPDEYATMAREMQTPVDRADVVPGFSRLTREAQAAVLTLVEALNKMTTPTAHKVTLGYGELPSDAVQHGRTIAYSDQAQTGQTSDSG